MLDSNKMREIAMRELQNKKEACLKKRGDWLKKYLLKIENEIFATAKDAKFELVVSIAPEYWKEDYDRIEYVSFEDIQSHFNGFKVTNTGGSIVKISWAE